MHEELNFSVFTYLKDNLYLYQEKYFINLNIFVFCHSQR